MGAVFVKICGITTEDDALLAVAMGANALGFVFAPSKRQIAPPRAADIAKRIPSEILTFGVFRNESPDRVVKIVNRSGLSGAQLHGHESAEETIWVADRVPRIIKAFAGGSAQAARANEWKSNPILLDAPAPGSGEVFDWTMAAQVPDGLRVVLAGGLRAANVAAAIQQVRPWGVDVSSGVEKAPGRKDVTSVKNFIANARAAWGELEDLPAPAPTPAVDPASLTSEEAPYDWRDSES